MESIIEFISRELVNKPEVLPLRHDSPLVSSGILDSLSILNLMLFLEEQFGVVVDAEDLVPANFETVDAICSYLQSQHQVQVVRG